MFGSTQNAQQTPWASVFLLLISMVSLQAGAAVAKQLLPLLGAAGTATLRLIFASLILIVVCRPWRNAVNKRSLSIIALYGVTLGSMNFFFCLALMTIPLGVAVALEFTGPLVIAIAASRRKLDFLWIGMAVVGIAILLPQADANSQLPWSGILFALCAAICWALYIVIGKQAAAVASGGTVTSIGMLSAALTITPIGAFTAGNDLFNTHLWPTALVIALLSSAIPYYLEMVALKTMPARTFGTLMSMEPAVAAISGIIILKEYLTGTQWMAVACIMVASFGSVISSRHPIAPPEIIVS